jgi:hypothetical protein
MRLSLIRAVLAIDPAATSTADADEIGIIVAGKDGQGQGLGARRRVRPVLIDGSDKDRERAPRRRLPRAVRLPWASLWLRSTSKAGFSTSLHCFSSKIRCAGLCP